MTKIANPRSLAPRLLMLSRKITWQDWFGGGSPHPFFDKCPQGRHRLYRSIDMLEEARHAYAIDADHMNEGYD